MTQPGVIKGLLHRGGLNADILTDGVISVGDEVVASTRVDAPVRVACAQVEPVVFDRAGTLDKLAATAADAAAQGAQLVLFPETFVPAYPSSRWVRALAAGGGKEIWARLARSSVTVPSADTERDGRGREASTGSSSPSA